MKPGRKLDMIIGEKIEDKTGLELMHEFLPYYSTEISDAWRIVGRLKGDSEFDLYWHRGQWSCYFHNTEVVYADTEPMAICLAALKSIGYDV